MGIFSLLFGSDPKKEIEECKKRIKNFESIIETIKKNNKNKTQAHYNKKSCYGKLVLSLPKGSTGFISFILFINGIR